MPKKEHEIARLLAEGKIAAELVRLGYSRGTVYKVNKRVMEERTQASEPPKEIGVVTPSVDPSIEGSEEVVHLKKRLRLAELDRELRVVEGTPGLDAKVTALERTVERLQDKLLGLEREVVDSPLSGLRAGFQCSCGEDGLVAVEVQCSSCADRTTYGWFPTAAE